MTDKPTDDYSLEKSGPIQPGYYIYKWLIRGLSSNHSNHNHNHIPLDINIPETIINNKANEISKLSYNPTKKSIQVDCDISMEDNVDREVLVSEMMHDCIQKSVSIDSMRRNMKSSSSSGSGGATGGVKNIDYDNNTNNNIHIDTNIDDTNATNGDGDMKLAVSNIKNEIVAVWKKPTWGPGTVCNYTELLLPNSLQGRVLEMSSNGVQLQPTESKGKGMRGRGHSHGHVSDSPPSKFADTGGGLHADIPAGVVQRYIHGRSRTAGFHRIFWQSSGSSGGPSGNPYSRSGSTTAYRVSRNVSYSLFDEMTQKSKNSYQDTYDDEVCAIKPPVKDKEKTKVSSIINQHMMIISMIIYLNPHKILNSPTKTKYKHQPKPMMKYPIINI